MAPPSPRSPILADLVGGISLAGLMIPEAIAYSAIAGLPASFGLMAAITGPLAYAVIGRSRLGVVTATSGAAALLAAAISNAGILDVPRSECALALTLLIGLFFLVGAAFRLASLTSFVSRAVLRGFGLGLAITITVRQLPGLLGLRMSQGTPLQILGSMIADVRNIHEPSALLGFFALIFVGLSRRFRFSGAGLVLTFAAILAMYFGPAGHFGIATAGPLDLSFSAPRLPTLAARDWARLAQLALPIALVVLAESWATIRSLAVARGEPVSAEREITKCAATALTAATSADIPNTPTTLANCATGRTVVWL